MFTFIRQSPNKLRLWLLATVAVLLLTSVLEAGHIHGAFSAAEDHCTLCQHTISLDKVLSNTAAFIIPALPVALIAIYVPVFISRPYARFTHIRAPPAQLHAI